MDRAKNMGIKDLKELLVKCWMTHDAMWFLHTLNDGGIEKANKINKAAIGVIDNKDSIFYLDKTLLRNKEMFIGKGSSLVKGMQKGERIKVKEVSLSNYILNNFNYIYNCETNYI